MIRTIHSDVTGKDYNPKDCVRILNVQQAAAYIFAGAELIDMYASKHYETGNPVLIFLFDREATADMYDKWCDHTLY